MEKNNSSEKFYQKEWFMWIMLILFAPIGIFLLWKYDNKNKSTKIILSVFSIILFFGMYGQESNQSSIKAKSISKKSKSKNKVELVDFSMMTKADIDTWCSDKKISCKYNEEYSDSVDNGGFINQSVKASINVYEGDIVYITTSIGKKPTMGQTNALKKAKQYLMTMSFSHSGLIKQLEFEGFSNKEASYGADNCGADWNDQAVKKAKSYLDMMAYSRDGLIEQLEFEGFSNEEAVYGVSKNGY